MSFYYVIRRKHTGDWLVALDDVPRMYSPDAWRPAGSDSRPSHFVQEGVPPRSDRNPWVAVDEERILPGGPAWYTDLMAHEIIAFDEFAAWRAARRKVSQARFARRRPRPPVLGARGRRGH